MAIMTRTRENTSDLATASSPSPIQPDIPWSVVTAGKGKNRSKKQQQHISFKPTFVQPRVSTATDSSQALADQSPPAPVACVVPHMKGAEKGSVFLDITHVKDLNLLREALDSFNKDADSAGGRGHNEFLGRCEKNRTYLNHVYMETLWAPHSGAYHTIVNDGIMLSDNTFLKGFPSYPADASIVRLTLSGLPFLALPLLKASLHEWLQRFGEVLDLGATKKDGYYVGGGYATIAIPPGDPCATSPCHLDHTHFEPLQRAVPWIEDDGDIRKILLSWDTMPDFCRLCGSSDHCRADCPDRYSWLKCFNCHQTGHEWKHCPRNNDAKGTEAPNKARAVTADTKKKSRKTPLKVNNSEVSPMIVDKPTQSPAGDQETLGHQSDDSSPSDPHKDTNMDAVSKPPSSSLPSDLPGEEVEEMETDDSRSPNPTKNRSQSPEPEDNKKITKTNNSMDVAAGRKQQTHGEPVTDDNTQHNDPKGTNTENTRLARTHGSNLSPPSPQQ